MALNAQKMGLYGWLPPYRFWLPLQAISPSRPKRRFNRKSALNEGYPPPFNDGKNSPLEVLAAGAEVVLKPKPTSTCCACAAAPRKHRAKTAVIKVSFFNSLSPNRLSMV